MGLPVAGTFELTPRCNFNCKMCYVHLDDNEASRRGRELTADEWLSIAEAACKKGLVFLLLTGGEPLVRRDFKYLYTELQKMGLLVSINTNASLISGEYLEFFKKNPPSRLNISLYGASDETYEALCGNRQFGSVVNNIKALKEAGIAVKLNITFGPHNIGDMDGIQRISKELGVPMKPTTYLYPPVRVDAEGVGYNKERFDPAEAAHYEFESDKKRFEHEMFVKRTVAVCNGIRTVSDEECDGIPSEGISCRAGRSSFWVTWDGKMLPCGMMTYPAAYPLKDGFDAAWESTLKSAAKIFLPPECKSCSHRHVCHICAASAYAETGSFDKKPEYICEMVHTLAGLYKEEYSRLEARGEIEKISDGADK